MYKVEQSVSPSKRKIIPSKKDFTSNHLALNEA
jgi:hypothetical protein